MPRYDVAERHEVTVDGAPEALFPLLVSTDFASSPVVRWLFRLRGLPRDATTLRGAVASMGFVPLGERAPEEIVLGLTGKFWTLTGHIRRVDAAGFRGFAEPGWAQAAWSFSLTPDGARTRLATETRVRCTDERARRRFR